MWNYEKRLQFPVNIKKPDARAAQVIMSSMEDRTEKWEHLCDIFPRDLLCRTEWQWGLK